jgi:hypothetical protein
MKKIIVLLLAQSFIISSYSSPNKETNHPDSIIRQDSTIQISNKIKNSLDLFRKTQNHNLTLLIQGQDSISNNILRIGKFINAGVDSIQKTLHADENPSLHNQEKQGCNICTILGSIIGALLSGLVAIGIFMLGRKIDRKKEKQKLYDFGDELYSLIKNITINSKVQVGFIKTLVKSIKEKPYTHGDYQKISNTLLKRAQSFDTTLTFNTFKILNLEKKSYIKFYSSIDFLFEVFSSIDDDYHNKNSEAITPLSNVFISLRQEILTLGTDFTDQKRKEKDLKNPLYLFLENLVLVYYKNIPSTIDLKYDMEVLIRPLKYELLSKYRDIKIASDLLTLAKEAGDNYETIIQENIKFYTALEGQIESVNSMISRLEEIESELKSIYAS